MLHGNRVIAIRARARDGWSIKKIARRYGVSRNTVRCYLRQGPLPVVPRRGPDPFEDWELKLARKIARTSRTADRDELESVLTWHLARLQHRRRAVNNWKAFLLVALRRKAITWMVAQQKSERSVARLDGAVDDDSDRTTVIPDTADDGVDTRIAFSEARRSLPGALRRVLDVLVAEHYSKTRAAARLGLHRNSIANALARIAKVLRAHGF